MRIFVVFLIATNCLAQEAQDCFEAADCTNHGSCNNGICNCMPGWLGRYCGTSACQRRPCMGDTVCVGINTCQSISNPVLPSTFQPPVVVPTRPMCPQGCGNGRCVAPNLCQCQPGYTGSTCSSFMGPVGGATKVGDRCFKDDDCVRNAYCENFAMACTSGGTCTCRVGFVESNGRCVIAKRVGDDCSLQDTNAICVDDTTCNSESNQCVCKFGFAFGPIPGTCDSILASKKAGERCGINAECFYDLECSNDGVCGCPIGEVPNPDMLTCRSARIGDQCRDNRDCSSIGQAECNSATPRICACSSGFKATPALDPKGRLDVACADGNVVKSGGACPVTRSSICKEGYACITCPYSNSTARCLWPASKGPEPTTPAPPKQAQAQSQSIMSKASHRFDRHVELGAAFVILALVL